MSSVLISAVRGVGGVEVAVEGLAGVGERVDAIVEPVQARSSRGQQLGAGLGVGAAQGSRSPMSRVESPASSSLLIWATVRTASSVHSR